VIDWTVARLLATRVAGAPAVEAFGDLPAAAAESERLVAAYTGLHVAGGVPVAEAISRPAWIEANLASMRAILEPVAGRMGAGLGPLREPARLVMGAVLGAEVGAISGLLATRVLGQYDFPLLDPDAPARLLFVAPNLSQVAASLDADADELLRWVALHETTHAVQFGGVPWLRGYLGDLIRELLTLVDVNPRALVKRPDLADVRALVDHVREGGIGALVVSPAQRALLDRIQAVMSVLEGYAEHVMDAVGEEILPSLPQLREGLEARRDGRPPVWRILEKLLGLDRKMRQYREGKVFCDAVVERGGIAALNRVWDSPEAMPDTAELADPEAWMRRLGLAA
jgi:coenzyme F420 biosynthesis associated uncharacterized protein